MLDVGRREEATNFIKYVNIPNQETALQGADRTFGLMYWRMILLALERDYCTESELVQTHKKHKFPHHDFCLQSVILRLIYVFD